MKKKYNFVYKTVNNLNGDYYYGVHTTDNLDDGYMGSGIRLNHSINKYGVENFTRSYVKFFDCLEDAYSLEAEIVTPELLQDPHCMNLISGGHGGSCYKFTKEQCKVQSENAKKQWESEEARKQNAESNKKTWSDPELRKKHSEICKNSNTEETREKKSISAKKRWQDQEYVKRQKEINSGKNNPMYGKTPWNKGKHYKYIDGKRIYF